MPTASTTRRDIEFTAGGITVRGWLQLPATHGPHPVVVLGHGLGGLKEWTIPDVADAFVDSGIAALAFDYRNWGDSDGEPRDEVDHCGRIEDWQSAITFATTVPELDPDRIGIWGTSLGGRDVIIVAALDARVRCVVSQVPLIHWEAPFVAWFAGYGDDLAKYHSELARDRHDRLLGRNPIYLPFDNPDDTGEGDHADYVASWGEAERRNHHERITLQSFQPTVLRDASPFLPLIAPTPLRMLIADNDMIPGQQHAFALAGEPKDLLTYHGDHYSLYTRHKDAAITAAREWFERHLT